MNAVAATVERVAVSTGGFALSLLCLSRSWGGLELNTVRFAGWMQQRGWAVQLITLPDSPMAARAQELNLPVVVLRNRLKAVDIVAARQLAEVLRHFGTQSLVVTRNGDLGLAVLCKKCWVPSLRLVYQQHMQLGIAKRGLIHTLRYRALDAWLTPLPGLARQVLTKTRLPATRLHVVPLGIELKKFAYSSLTQAEARAQLGLSLAPGTVLLGLIGRFDRGKGQKFVVKALARLRQQYPQLQLLLVGESTLNEGNGYKNRVLARIRRLRLSQVVHVRPFTLQPEVAYRALDIALVASTNETYGMVTLEAQATGLPVVACATGGTLELVDDGQTGLLFPLHNAEALNAAIERLLQSPDLAARLGRQAKAHVLARYSHQQQCALTEQVLLGLGQPAGSQ
ncbi:glycosyltransferase family 4 protein [Hymenobacter baengnokdamensis]|uniref:glycosyltransferase family 4 protein n=1 Tax=Hymenobacter baengnokdamensis TaxID=2615203 RepID=UPI00177FF41A|nr:glycosyltransferase family 4 protein [Hymenobacter baengnokdamensis]